MSRRDELQDILNNGYIMTGEELIELTSYEPDLHKKLVHKAKTEVGEHYCYRGEFQYEGYSMIFNDLPLHFKYRKDAIEFEKEMKRRIELAGINKPFTVYHTGDKFDSSIAKKLRVFFKFGITQFEDCSKRFKDKSRYGKGWAEKPGWSECYYIEDTDKILQIFDELKSELESQGKLFGPIDKFVK